MNVDAIRVLQRLVSHSFAPFKGKIKIYTFSSRFLPRVSGNSIFQTTDVFSLSSFVSNAMFLSV